MTEDEGRKTDAISDFRLPICDWLGIGDVNPVWMVEMQENRAHDCLVAVIEPFVIEQGRYLDRLKREGLELMNREDLIWYSLLSSMSTMGRVDGY